MNPTTVSACCGAGNRHHDSGEMYCTKCATNTPTSPTETVSDCCKWCDQEINYDFGIIMSRHECRECHDEINYKTCKDNQGLCGDCRVIQEGRL